MSSLLEHTQTHTHSHTHSGVDGRNGHSSIFLARLPACLFFLDAGEGPCFDWVERLHTLTHMHTHTHTEVSFFLGCR